MGWSPEIVSRLLEAGQLPNLARLKEQGGFARVATTRPAQTPVAWSTFATGTNPGGHGIFDFLRRNPKNYLPDLALNRYEQKNAFLPPKAVNLRRGTPVWELLDGRGHERDRPALSRAPIRPTRSAAGCSRAWASPTCAAGWAHRRSTPRATRSSPARARTSFGPSRPATASSRPT